LGEARIGFVEVFGFHAVPVATIRADLNAFARLGSGVALGALAIADGRFSGAVVGHEIISEAFGPPTTTTTTEMVRWGIGRGTWVTADILQRGNEAPMDRGIIGVRGVLAVDWVRVRLTVEVEAFSRVLNTLVEHIRGWFPA